MTPAASRTPRTAVGALRGEPAFVPDVLERGQVVIHAEGPSRVVVRFYRLKTLF